MIYGTMVRQSNMLAFADAFWVMGGLFLLVIPMMLNHESRGRLAGQVVME